MLVVVVAAPAALAAQSPIYPSATGGAGPDVLVVSFGQGIGLANASQTVFRVFGGVPVGRRLFVDASGNYALTALRASDGTRVDLSGLTDTQLRASYTVGRDRLVTSLLLNVPTGAERVTTDQVPLLRSIAQNFLPFPVSTYGAGAGITGAVALAQQLGAWTVGAAGSVRYLASYSPYADVNDTYAPGLESRIRLGARRMFGERTSATIGLTFSTFGADDFSGVQNYTYRPGDRVVLEGAISRQLGRTTARLSGWGFFRAAGDSSGTGVIKAREHIVYGGLTWTVPVGARLRLSPGVDARGWRAADGASGELAELSVDARLGVGARCALASSVRLETGTLRLAPAVTAGFTGVGLTVFLRAGI